MKIMSLSSLSLAIAVSGMFLMYSCKKKEFKSGPGLYGTKQYHNYVINGVDTAKLKDVQIGIKAMDNSSYLAWNNITFRLYKNIGDTTKVFINDSLIGSTRHILYTLTYQVTTDDISVINEQMDRYWVSF